MTNENLLLTQLISTKLCHDMAGSINATNNALELLADENDPEMVKNINELLSFSAKESMAKLKLYRLAYGVGSVDSSSKVEETQQIINDFFEGSKVNVNWDLSQFDQSLDGVVRRIISGTTLIISSFLIFGGNISISQHDKECAKIITIEGSNQRIKEDKNAMSILSGENRCQIDVYNAHLFLLCEQLQEANFKYSFVQNQSTVEFKLFM